MIELVPGKFNPNNNIIKDHTKPLPPSHYKKGEFLVKLANGDDYYGLPQSKKMKQRNEYLNFKKKHPDDLWIYDKFRNISGISQHRELTKFVRQLGRLAGEKVYNKRVYLYARLISLGKKKIVLEVRSNEILHEQGW